MNGFIGGIVIVIGVLIAGLGGLCTLLIFSVQLVEGRAEAGNIATVGIGIVQLLIGLAAIRGGITLIKTDSGNGPPPSPPAPPAPPSGDNP